MPAAHHSEPIEDKILVERAARGDEMAFATLVTRHYRRAVRVAFGLLRNQADAEDVAQDAFVKVHSRLSSFEGTSAFYTWLYRIVVNLSIDALRKRRRDRRAPESGLSDDNGLGSETQPDNTLWPTYDNNAPEQHMERRELNRDLAQAFGGLSEMHRAVLLLRELEGLSYDEIADTLQIKRGTVMSRLFHARKLVQDHFSRQKTSNQSRAVPERS